MKKKINKVKFKYCCEWCFRGIGEFFGIDPTIVRIVYLALSFFTAGFHGFFLYILLAIIVPSRPPNIKQEKNYYGNYYGDGMNRETG